MEKEESTLDLRRFWRAAMQWRWLLIAGTVLLTAAGAWFGFSRLTKYEINGEVLIGDNSAEPDSRAGGLQQMMRTFSVGGFSGTAVNNELMILGSHDVFLRTVRALNLNRVYIAKNAEGKKSRLYQDLPVRVEAPAEQFDTLNAAFNIKIEFLEGGKVDIRATKGFFKTLLTEAKGVTLPYNLKTPYGSYQILAGNDFDHNPYTQVNVTVTGNELAATDLYKQVMLDTPDKMADIISLDYSCDNAQLGMATINAVMGEYNSKRRERLHETSKNSIQYYDERIAETFKALQQSEQDVKEYQKKNELMGVESELELLVEDAVGSKREIRTANYNIAYYETVLDLLRNRLGDDILIPQMESLSDPNIQAINGAIQARRDLRRSATENNEALLLLNKRIDDLRDIIIENSTKMIAKAKADVRHKQRLATSTQDRLNAYPDYQLDLVSLMRDKENLNALYLYLVNQRESAVLQLYSVANVGYVFQPAYVVKEAGIFKKLIWPIATFILSIACCIIWSLLMMWCSRKVKDTMDLAFLGIEANSVNVAKSPGALNTLRNRITANPDIRVLYFNALPGTETMRQQFAETLLSIGRNVEVLTGFNNNDAILTPDTRRQITEALQTNDYVIVSVPDPANVSDLENAINADNAALLLSLRSGKMTRSQLKQLLKGQTVDKVFTILCK